MDPIKPGKNTSEFYLTLLAQILGIAVTFGLLTTGDVSAIVEATNSLVVAISVLLVAMTPLFAAFGVLVKYINARTQLKVQFEKAKAAIKDMFDGR